ncbi:Heat shock protein DnaJ N-terminal [Penicillium cinerascens]|uniref:Heat shock protein DnaJ N-terminal n=1 Tax=Penicillium cinerascens TaxID=70096 RepID=A0A9W9MP63_9EURO|nr:Heat shock protein DnaJ N-terminal [Penicillium cinerascens]KAJ5204865.1 Heat shock protein DnaJ N-terminal [Penicillium cinerascens]
MVKADVRRDYYADLGLQPSAETEDIKKQFRKLALKYHPDRNPGKEQDFIARFQAIQAANEILSDPQQRLKYDTDRLRAGYGKVYGPPKTNTTRRQAPTYATTQPPKPQPPRQQYSSRPQASSKGPSAGAQRYAAHARAGPQQWQNPQDEAQTRADAFRAFHGMRGSNPAGWRGFDPETGRATPSSGGTPRQQNAPFGAQRPKSAYEYFKDSMKSQGPSSPNSPKKRNGFAPGTAGGDEPMARNTSAYTSTRSERPSSMYFDSAPPPTAKKPSTPETAPSFAQRTGTSYATSGGEKTFFSSSGLGRSSTVRTPSGSYRTTNSRTTPSSPVNGESEGHRSASPKARRNRTYSASTSSSELEDDDTEDDVRPPNTFKPKAVPKSRLGPNQKFADFYRHENSSSGLGENPPTRSSSQHFRPPTPRPSEGWRRPAPSHRGPYFMDLDADTYEYKGHNSDSAAFPKGSYRPDPQAQSKDPINSAQKRTNPQSTPFERNIPGNLHKKFSAEDWREHLHKFDFIGANASPTDRQSPNTHNRPRASTRTDSTQTGTSTGSPGFKSFSPGSGNQSHRSQPPQQPTPFAQAKFHADQWFEKVKDISWNAQEADKARSSSNTPPRSPKKQARSGTKLRSAPQAASVATESDEAEDTINGNTPPEPSQSVPADAEAMDIDEPPGPTSAMPDSASAGDSRSTSYPDLTAHATRGPLAGVKKSQPTPQAEGDTPNRETRTPLFDLDNLRNTVPFTSTNSGGIENLEDVHANLPFDSRAKQPTTTKRDIQPRELKLPNPPKRPWAPQPTAAYAGSQQLTLSRDKWNWYVSAMSTYMHDWNTFNRRMLLHFNTRQEAIETGLSPKWISAVGDTARLHINGIDEEDEKSETREDVPDESDDLVPGSGKGGFSAYLRGIEEDIQVRKHWDVACELHRECILDLGRLREWIRNGGKVV